MKTEHIGKWAGKVFRILGLAFLAFIVLYPFLWMFVTSFKAEADIVSWPPKLFSGSFGFDSYIDIWDRVPFLKYYKNTIIFSTLVTCISLMFDTMAGYAFARMKFPGRNIMFLLVMGTMMIPFQVIMVPLFVEVFKLGLINTYAGLILPRATNAFGIFMMRSFFISLPKGLEEAGRIDGAGEFRIFAKIMVPLCKPAIVSLFIFHFMYQWNDLLYPLLLTTDENRKTLPAGLATFMGTHVVEYGIIMAGACLSLIPILIAYLFAQKQFVQGIAMTGMKG
jgi:multiple sugar transport system permease protein